MSVYDKEIKELDSKVKGTRILVGDYAERRRNLINSWVHLCRANGFREVVLPSLEYSSTYTEKAGEEILDQMYIFQDKGNPPRNLCLRPEGTATLQLLADKYKYTKDIKVFYEVRCWRYERPQKGRYREFTQFGVEWLNPKDKEEALEFLKELAKSFILFSGLDDTVFNDDIKRGLSYYTAPGFEIECESLGAQKQILGGGEFDQGVGFAVGLDRVLEALDV